MLVLLGVLGTKSTSLPNIPEEFEHPFSLLETDISQKNYDAALIKIKALLHQLKDSNPDARVWLYDQQAKVHTDKYHLHFAIASLRAAKELSQNKNKYQEQINHLGNILSRKQTERNHYKTYRDARNTGIAKTLKKKVTIAYFYLDDNRWSKWSNKARLKNSANVEQVITWYKQQAKHYDIKDLSFKTRYFFLRSPKGLGKEWIRKREFFQYTAALLANQLGYKSLNHFVKALQGSNPENEVALVFHTNGQARSFAGTCLKVTGSNCKFEYVMLTESMTKRNNSWATTQVQAHEILHLFGAADLYNIEGAKNYAVTDIMNYYSRDLKYASITPLTAWSIGWGELPKTPFIVNEKKD